jgi:hypothetical protein
MNRTQWVGAGVCACGKRNYLSRKDARKVLRNKYPGERMHVYVCLTAGGFHIGHMAPEVACGEVPKELFYGPKGVGRVREKQKTRLDPKTRRVAA